MTTHNRGELLARSLEGDEASFTSFVEAFQPIVFRWAIGLVGDGDDADDVTQEVFVIVYGHLRSYRSEGSLDGWLYRITRRVALRRHRKAKRRAVLDALPAAHRTSEVYTTDPGARVDRENVIATITEALKTLPPRQREIFDLCDLQGMSQGEAAELLSVKAVSVRANLFKARAAIRRNILRMHPRYSEQGQ